MGRGTLGVILEHRYLNLILKSAAAMWPLATILLEQLVVVAVNVISC